MQSRGQLVCRDEFIADMPESYKNTLSVLQGLVDKLKEDAESETDLPKRDKIKIEISIINSMVTDASILATLTRRYYDSGYSNPKPFSMVQVPQAKSGQFGDVDYDEKVLRKIFGDSWRD